MWNNIKSFSSVLLQCTELLTYSKRTTFILRRLREPRLSPLGSKSTRKLKRREYYYKFVENTLTNKSPTTELVLLKNVPGTGMAGDKVELNRYSAYKNLILPKLAIYATSPEASAGVSVKEECSSMFSKIIENYLSTRSVPVFLSNETKWSLEPWHIKTALRKIGISTSNDCITLPSEKILGPNPEIENRDFIVQVTMNKSEKFDVRCRIFHWSQKDQTINPKVIDMVCPSEPLFPEQKEVINKLIENEKELKKSKKMSSTLKVQGKGKKKKFFK